MSPRTRETAELEHNIEAVFSLFPMPGPDEIAPPGDDSLEARELRAAFAGKHWKEVPFETLMYWRDDLGSFSAKSWVYYLPALLILALQKENSSLVIAAIHTLTPYADDAGLAWFNERLALLGQEHREVLRDCLHRIWPVYYADDDDVEDDPRPFWDTLIKIPNGVAAKPPDTAPPTAEEVHVPD